jgi:lysyl-tRNA synthetase class II
LYSQYSSLEANQISDTEVSIAGRVYTKRNAAKKLIFYDLRGEGVKIQVMADFAYELKPSVLSTVLSLT